MDKLNRFEDYDENFQRKMRLKQAEKKFKQTYYSLDGYRKTENFRREKVRQRMKFAIGIPTLNRFDVLQPSLLLYAKDFKDITIYIVDNGKQNIAEWCKKIPNIVVIENNVNVGVGASWNQLCKEIFILNDYALILNDDIYLGKDTEQIINIIKKNNKAFITPTPDWCAFIISKEIYEKVGEFDECFFPAYYEDNSYAYRMKLNRVVHLKTPLLNPYIYRSSMTLEKDYSILDSRKKNLQLYIKMWGGEPTKEIFLKPYNKKT